MENQLSIMEAILDLLCLRPLYLLGLGVTGLLLYLIFRRNKQLPKIKITIGSVLLYYYLCIVLNNIVGIPTISEFNRLTNLGETFFHPNISWIPFVNGIGLEFILNIFCFIPLGFLCPVISKTYNQIKNAALLGFGLSLAIEISQLFTLYRATDINDLIANVLGTIVGLLCFRLVVKPGKMKSASKHCASVQNEWFLPIFIILWAFVIVFIS